MASFPRAALLFLVLLVAILCCSATSLDVEEKQKEKEALESVDNVVSRADGVPDPPQNLILDPQSPTSIMLIWQDPDDTTDLDHYLVYVVGEDMQDTTTENFYVVENLESCTNYTFGVMSVSVEENMSDLILEKGQTEVGADGVPDPPQNLMVDPQTPTSVLLIWQDPDDTTDLYHYLVYVEGEDMRVTTTANYYLVPNLESCTDYTFGVMSVSVEGNMSDPVLENGETGIGAPPAPQILAVDGYSSTTVTLSWEEPDTLCDVEEYRVKWIKDGIDAHNERTNETSFTVTGLSIDTTYTFTVAGITEYGTGEEASVQQTTKLFDGGPPENLVAVGISESEINVSWTPLAYEPSYYLVTAPPCMYLSDKVFNPPYLITGLDPCDGCIISVTSYYNDSFQYMAELSGFTQGGAPPAPQNLQVDGYTSTAVMLSWDKPDTLCDIVEYRVRWSTDGTDTQSTTTSETSFTVAELSKNTTYIFSVTASTSYGPGPEATVQQTTDAIVGGPPENLVAVGVSSSAINVSWSPAADEPNYYVVSSFSCDVMEDRVSDLSYPITGRDPCETCEISVTSHYDDIEDCTQCTAYVTGTTDAEDPPPPESCFVQVDGAGLRVTWVKAVSDCSLGQDRVQWTGTKLWGDGGEESGSVTTAGATHYIDTVPYSQYTFEISSSIDGVFGSPSSCSGTSSETQPGSPVIVEVDSVQGEAVVTWETPAEENGLIVEYGIFVDGATSPQKIVSGNVHSTSLTLDPCETHSLSIEARNGAGWGPPSEAKDVTVVGDVLPEAVDCCASDFNVEVCWDPYDETCPVSQYNLMWEGDVLWSEELVDSNSTSLEWSTNRTCQSITGLPYTTYYVELTVGSGTDYKNCSVTTPMAAASPPTDLVQVAMDISSVTVQWSLPEFLRGRLLGWYLNWTSAIGHYLGEQDVTNPEERMLQIGDLDPSEVYNVYVMAVNGAGKGELAMLETSTEYVP